MLRRLQYFGERIGQMRTHFRFDRDPGDEKFIELAIAGEATRIVTCDKDLLSLASGHKDAAKRFRQRLPGAQVLDPLTFVRELESAT